MKSVAIYRISIICTRKLRAISPSTSTQYTALHCTTRPRCFSPHARLCSGGGGRAGLPARVGDLAAERQAPRNREEKMKLNGGRCISRISSGRGEGQICYECVTGGEGVEGRGEGVARDKRLITLFLKVLGRAHVCLSRRRAARRQQQGPGPSKHPRKVE